MRTKNNKIIKHTPGPWVAHISEYKEHSIRNESGQTLISEVQLFDADEQTLANAKLIAAAPELLAACIEFVRKCDVGEARSVRSYKQMSEAIKKAGL